MEGAVTPAQKWKSLLLGYLNKADNGMSSHKTLDREYIGQYALALLLNAFIGGFGRVQGVIYTLTETSAGIDSDALLWSDGSAP